MSNARGLPQIWAQKRADEMRRAAGKARRAYTKPYMSEPCNWFADVLEEAAKGIEARVAEAKAEGRWPEYTPDTPAPR